ncbi:MAG: PEP-CTERM system TPR-repeat protein PrsT [Gammaproteobacteria bacterium]|nr:PEP-CTERM system TPR-repeat protein PrsT [Gammaproteobacteria bacterium]
MPSIRTIHLLLCAALAFVNTGPAGAALAPSTAAEFHEKAVQLESQHKALDAIIEIKNALQADPNHLPSLLLAGRIYLEQSLGLAAEDSLRTALNAGADRSLVLPLLGEALLLQRKAARVLVEVQPDGLANQAAARVHALRAQAHLLRQETTKAAAEIDRAQALEPDLLDAQLARATLEMHENKPLAARDIVADAVARHPGSSEAWSLYGAIQHTLRKPSAALDAYAKAIELTPRNIDVRIARVGLLIDLGRDAEATPDLDYIDEEFPKEPRAAYLRSVIAARAGDLDAARAALDVAITALIPLDEETFQNDPALQLILGLANYGLQRYEAAAAPLQAYIVKQPRDVGARKALGDILLRLGSARDAIPVLEPVTTLAPEDSRARLLLATAYAISGYEAKATALLEDVTGEPRSAAAARGRLAMLNIGAGRVTQGLSDLATAFAEDPSDAQGGIALVVTYMRQGRLDDAVTAARTLAATDPANPVFTNLLGIALFTADKTDEARPLFEQILAEQPDFRPAAINLAKLDLRTGKLDAARTRLQQLLAVKPDDSKVMLELSRVALAAGDKREGLRLAEDAARPRKAGLDALFHLYNLYLADGKLDEAYDLALRAKARDDTNFEVLERLAAVLIRLGQRDDARATLKTMSQVAGFDPDKQLRTASYQIRIGQFADAEYALFKALQENPDHQMVRLAQIELSLAKRAFDEARERASALIAQQPELAAAFVFRAQAALGLRDYAGALEDYDRANSLSPSTEGTLGGYRALAASGRLDDARARLERWLERHPDDVSVRIALGEHCIRAGELERARTIYDDLVAARPEDAGLRNNLALLDLQLGDNARALDNARAAYTLAPQDAGVNDTLGWILVQTGAHEEALNFLREALARRAGDNEIRYHLAVVLERLGRPQEARTEVEQVLANGRDFASRAAALSLRDSLDAAAP